METIKVISTENYGDNCLGDRTAHVSQVRTPTDHVQVIQVENKQQKVIYDSADQRK